MRALTHPRIRNIYSCNSYSRMLFIVTLYVNCLVTIRPSITLRFKFQLLPRTEGFYFMMHLDACMTIRYIETTACDEINVCTVHLGRHNNVNSRFSTGQDTERIPLNFSVADISRILWLTNDRVAGSSYTRINWTFLLSLIQVQSSAVHRKPLADIFVPFFYDVITFCSAF